VGEAAGVIGRERLGGLRRHPGDVRDLSRRVAVVDQLPGRFRPVVILVLRVRGHGSNATPRGGGTATAGGPGFRGAFALPADILRGVRLEEHRTAFLEALLARDSARARRAVEDALAEGAPVPDLYLDLLQPALREIGHRWAMGSLNVAEEHYATTVAASILDGLGRRLPRRPRDGRLAVVTGTPEELHALGTRMVADFLEADGWEVLLLGPGAPARDLAALVEQEQPDLVALSTATAGVLDGVAEVLRALAALRPRPFVVAGGQFWTAETSATALELGADLVVHGPRELVALMRERIPPPDAG